MRSAPSNCACAGALVDDQYRARPGRRRSASGSSAAAGTTMAPMPSPTPAFAREHRDAGRLRDGQNDFKRAARQQDVLLALRSELAGANLVFELPGILDAIGRR